MKLNLSKLFVVTLITALSFPALAALDTAAPTVEPIVASNGVSERQCPQYPQKCGLDCQSH